MSDSKKKHYPQIRPKRYGGYSLIVMGESERHRAYLLKHLTECRIGLVDDLGGEQSLTMAQTIIIDRVISKLGIIRCVEEYVKENGTFQEKHLAPPLKESYLAYSNSIRLDLLALGIEKKIGERILTPFELAAAYDEKKGRKRARNKPKRP